MWEYASFNNQGLTSLRAPAALAFGTLVHKIHEEWLENPDEPIDNIVGRVAIETHKELTEQYIKVVGVAPSPQEFEIFQDSVAMALDIFTNYQEFYSASLPQGFTLMHAEQTITVPIPGTEHECELCGPSFQAGCPECQGTGVAFHRLEGTLDALMADESGRLWVLERKTYNSKPRIDHMQMNEQFLAYLWLLTQLGMGDVGGVMYDGMWKRFRTTDKGLIRPLDELFYRVPLIRSPEEISNFTIQLRDEVMDMADPNLRIYRNVPWTGCFDCQFAQLCMAEFRGEDAEYVRKRFYIARPRTRAFTEDA